MLTTVFNRHTDAAGAACLIDGGRQLIIIAYSVFASERLRNVLKGSADPVTKHLRMCVSALHRCQLHRKVSAPQLPVT